MLYRFSGFRSRWVSAFFGHLYPRPILSKRVNAAPVRLLISLSIQAQLMNETPSYKKRPEPRVTVDTWFSVCTALLSQQHFADHVPPFGGSWMEDVQ